MRTGRGGAADDGDPRDGRVDQNGRRGADPRDGRGELHLGACRELSSGVPGPRKGQGQTA
jgi:hypothetical protein